MRKEKLRNRSVTQQTLALLWKNVILKWRMRMQCFQEFFASASLFIAILMISYIFAYGSSDEIPQSFLGRLDDPSFNFTGLRLICTPETKMTRKIMEKIETVMEGIQTKLVEDEKALEAAHEEDAEFIGVVFQDDTSYRLRFHFLKVVSPSSYLEYIDYCYNYSSDYCQSPRYWYGGFLSLQSSIDSAIIEQITGHSVWDEMKSISGIRMRTPSVDTRQEEEIGIFFVSLSMCFSPFLYYLSQNMTREKRKLKEMMKTMGLRDAAFWLSWGLPYAGIILIMSLVMAYFLHTVYCTRSSFSVLFLLFSLYGISSISFCFMISSLLKKPKATSFVSFLLIFGFGAIAIAVFFNMIPTGLIWVLSLFCPFAFGTGIAKAFLYQKYGKYFFLSNLMYESHAYVLFFDGVLYMLLALYFDKTVPDKYGVPYHPLFFLKKFYWFKPRGIHGGHGNIFNDNIEPVPPEFDGKKVIRINNIKKIYKTKNKETEALRDLSLNIYEGQITAVLGHNGAGKTTLLNILSGLSKPSDGSVTIFKDNISEMGVLDQVRDIIAVCPQFNVQFELLTVKENLKTFAKIKGIPSHEIESEVKKIITLLDMEAIQDSRANCLSGGQKRKLTLGITFLGDPQVLLLDEPTAGLDPYSRQKLWALLNERKAGRVTLFTTQTIEEADILADRIAFISHGRLMCVGSSLFLKKKWGIGYHLRMHVNEVFDSERTTSLIKQYIPGARLSGQHEKELSYTLPLENVDKFPDLFCDMDNQTDLGIVNYGVTMTTLEDVFLKLEGKESLDEKALASLLKKETEEPRKGVDLAEEGLLLSDMAGATLKGMELWRQQVCAVARMHFFTLLRIGKVWSALFLILGITVVPLLIQLLTGAVWKTMHYEELHPGLYFEPEKQYFWGTSGLLILNDTGESIDNFIQAVKSQNIQVDVVSGKNVSDQLVHNGAIGIALEEKKYRFTLMCHTEITNCFPVLVNIISNTFLGMLNSTSRIRIWSHLFTYHYGAVIMWGYFISTSLLGNVILSPAFPAHFAMTSIHDYKMKAYTQLRVSGLFPSAYWCGLALVDIPLHCILLLLLLWPWFFFFSFDSTVLVQFLLYCLVFIPGYGCSLVLFLYVIAFSFRKKQHPSSAWTFIFILVTFLALIFSSYLDRQHSYLGLLANFLIPFLPPTRYLGSNLILTDEDESFFGSYGRQIYIASSFLFIHSVIFIILLWYLVMKYDRPALRRDPVFRISPKRKSRHHYPEEPREDDDQDVQDERTRVQSALNSTDLAEKPVVLVHNLCKEYKTQATCSCCRKSKAGQKVATRNVSFGVKKGEVLGLLGPNGAGKSTTINIIIGETDQTAGQVLIKSTDSSASEGNMVGFLGYCPQENALWPNLTMKEHLEIYAAVKGMKKNAASIAIIRLVQALELQEHIEKHIKALAAGLTRKLCFALSMLGNPTVMLLDEPTAGMDPKGKRQVWRAIQSVLKDKDQGAILTTHHMEEAEAVCDRVAIMVAGQLRCLGSIQYLKSKFGKNYLLQIKVRGVEEGELLNAHILMIFPHAARQERISTLLVYKIPMKDALPLSKAFFQLEDAKQHFNFEEYSFSLNTLEQVFLELCKEQERDFVDTNLDTTFEWKKLQQDDF